MINNPDELVDASKADQETVGELANRLLLLSEKVIASENNDDDQLIEDYARVLGILEARLPEVSEGSEVLPILRQLENSHLQVMEKVLSKKESIKLQIGSLKKKGRIVITYTDHLPKSISLRATKKA